MSAIRNLKEAMQGFRFDLVGPTSEKTGLEWLEAHPELNQRDPDIREVLEDMVIPGGGKTHRMTIVRLNKFGEGLTLEAITQACYNKYGNKPPKEVAPVLRDALADAAMRKMDLDWVIVLHDVIGGHSTGPGLFIIRSGEGAEKFGVTDAKPDRKIFDGKGGFALLSN